MKVLRISDDLSLPIEAVTQKLAFLGRTGGGKTYAATKLCELMLDAKAQVVALDPVGKWYGLRGGAEGYPVPVFGGLYGDVPLESTAGAFMADLIVDRDISAVLDVSQFISSEQQRFAADFARRIFERRKEKPAAMHLFIEECQEFVPQNLPPSESGGHAKMMLHHFERLIKLGRNYGVGASLISQRPQEVNKKVLNQTEIMFAFQMTGPQERKAISAWVDDKGEDSSVVDALPSLKQGEAHVWSPVFLGVSKVVRIAQKKTADVSATPKVGERATAPKELSRVDVEEIRSAMAATVEKAKENDPKELKKKIAELQRQLKSHSPAVDEEAIERAVQSAVAARDREWSARQAELEGCFNDAVGRLERIAALAHLNGNAELPPPAKVAPARTLQSPTPRPSPVPARREAPTGGDMDGYETALLRKLADRAPVPTTRSQLAALTGYSTKSSAYPKKVNALVGRGYAEDARGGLVITAAGKGALGDYAPAPADGQDALRHWIAKLPSYESRILSTVAEAGAPLTREDISERTGYSLTSSAFPKAVNNLVGLSFLQTDGATYEVGSVFA